MSSLADNAASQKSTEGSRVVVIDAARAASWFDWRELWNFRELIWILAARDITVRYRQAVVGVAWVVLQPVAEMIVFSGLFSLLGKRPAGEAVPYTISLLCGLLLWQLFAAIVGSATSCLVDNRPLLTKVYFPRMVLPLAVCLRPLVDFGVGLVVLAGLMTWFQIAPSLALLMMPLVVLATVITALALGLWLSALNAHYRDFGYIVPFLLRIGFFVSPVIYETASLNMPARWHLLYSLNPMSSLLESFRWSLIGTAGPRMIAVVASLVATLFVLVSGAWYFRRVERFLADRI